MSIINVDREVFKARCKKTKKLVALKKVLMENEKEGVSLWLVFSHLSFFLPNRKKQKLSLMKNTCLNIN